MRWSVAAAVVLVCAVSHADDLEKYLAVAPPSVVKKLQAPTPAKPAEAKEVPPVELKPIPDVKAVSVGGTMLLQLGDIGDGTYLLRKTANGFTLEPVTVIQLGPTPGPAPDPTVLTDRAKAIKAAVEGLGALPKRNDTAQSLATLYRECAKSARSGKVKDRAMLEQLVGQSTTMMLASDPNAAKWQPVRDLLSDQWDDLTREGRGLGDYATLLDEAASGLDASTGAKAGISPDTLALIMQLIELVLKLLNK
jgi:hypothetical protein